MTRTALLCSLEHKAFVSLTWSNSLISETWLMTFSPGPDIYRRLLRIVHVARRELCEDRSVGRAAGTSTYLFPSLLTLFPLFSRSGGG